MRLSLAAVAFVAWCACMLATSTSRAEPRIMRLEVVRVSGDCPDAQAFRDAVDVAAGADPFDDSAAARVVVTLMASASISRGRWEMFDDNGTKIRERSVTVAGSCKALVSELVLTFVVAYEATPPAPAPPSCPPAPPCDAACRADALAEARRQLEAEGKVQRMDVHAVVMAGGLLSAGYTADPGGGFFLAGGARGEIFSGTIEARVLMPSRAVAEPTKFAFAITSLSAALVPCAQWKVLLGCVLLDVGMLISGGGGTLPLAGPPVIATLGFGPRLGVQWSFAERFGLRAFADLRIAPVTSKYNFVDTGASWQSNVVSGLFGVGLTFE